MNIQQMVAFVLPLWVVSVGFADSSSFAESIQEKKILNESKLPVQGSDSSKQTLEKTAFEQLLDADRNQLQKRSERQKANEVSKPSISASLNQGFSNVATVMPLHLENSPQVLAEEDEAGEGEEEEEEKLRNSWLLDGVLKLSGKYDHPASLDPAFGTEKPASEEAAFSSTLLIDRMAAHKEKQRKEIATQQEIAVVSETTESVITLESILATSSHNKTTSSSLHLNKSNPYLSSTSRVFGNMDSSSYAKVEALTNDPLRSESRTIQYLAVQPLSSSNNNPFLQEQPILQSPQPIFDAPEAVPSAKFRPVITPPQTAPISQGLSKVQPDSAKRVKPTYIPKEVKDKKYFQRMERF